MASQAEWLAEIGTICEELGYGIRRLEWNVIELVGRDVGAIVTIERPGLGAADLQTILKPIGHRSGSPYTREYERGEHIASGKRT